MNRFETFGTAATLALAAACLSSAAHADVKWTLTENDCRYSSCGPDSGTGPQLTVSGWGATEPGGSNYELAPADVHEYSGGLGITNADAGFDSNEGSYPEHGIDNNERHEFMLFEYDGQAVTLSQVTFGWYDNDLDISVLAYTGDGTPEVDGLEIAHDNVLNQDGQLVDDTGWQLVGNYGNVQNNQVNGEYVANINSQELSSSYWLIGAYNPNLGDCSGCDLNSYKKDYMKLLAVKGDPDDPYEPPDDPPHSVPAPASLLLLAGALPLVGLRRRRRGAAPQA